MTTNNEIAEQVINTIEIRRHNGQSAYGEWLTPDGYDLIETLAEEALDSKAAAGVVDIGGQKYAWRRVK